MNIILPGENILFYTRTGKSDIWEVSVLPEEFDKEGYNYQARNLSIGEVIRCKDLKTLRHVLRIRNRMDSQYDYKWNRITR